jgi:hypothetical protein
VGEFQDGILAGGSDIRGCGQRRQAYPKDLRSQVPCGLLGWGINIKFSFKMLFASIAIILDGDVLRN